ncbi:MAG: regulatory iron-sulfur-containing complex subunit RicT [Pseudomonadota bacterium]
MEETTNTEQKTETPKPAMLAVGVQFRAAGTIHTFSTTDPSIAVGESVVVEAEGGVGVGRVMAKPREAAEGELPQSTRRLLHRASPEEMEKEARNREEALSRFTTCQEKIRERGLPMKLVDALLEEGGKKIVFIFYAEERVDFRGLVKDLATSLRMRIEMRQIGARDEAKHRGSLGPCGQGTCCSEYLRHFQPISISMAKHQGLAPNPAKLIGMCGKLKCCLAYEHALYDEYRKGLPKVGLTVSSPGGSGKIVGHNVLKRECTVRLFAGGECRCPCDDCKPLTQAERAAALEAARKVEESNEERSQRRAKRMESGRDRRERQKVKKGP